MKYYYIKRDFLLNNRGTSFLHIQSKSMDLAYDQQGYLDYLEPIPLLVRGGEEEDQLYFPIYEKSLLYIELMIPELKSVLEQFNMPTHRWYKAQAGYNLDFVDRMKKYFNIDYAIDINEKRDYWILQLLDRKREELAFDLIDFQLNDYDSFTYKDGGYLSKGTITSYDHYRQIRKIQIQSHNLYPEPITYIYQNNYDILWGGIDIIFNEKVKQALESTNIITAENGLEFVEFTSYQIEMLGENN